MPDDLRQPPTCAELQADILERFDYVEKVMVRDTMFEAGDRHDAARLIHLLLVTAVLKSRPICTVPRGQIKVFVQARLKGWYPPLPDMRVLCTTYDLSTGELDS